MSVRGFLGLPPLRAIKQVRVLVTAWSFFAGSAAESGVLVGSITELSSEVFIIKTGILRKREESRTFLQNSV